MDEIMWVVHLQNLLNDNVLEKSSYNDRLNCLSVLYKDLKLTRSKTL